VREREREEEEEEEEEEEVANICRIKKRATRVR
jgi:hypothetical protein